MDTKGEVEEMTYPHICFMVDNFDEVWQMNSCILSFLPENLKLYWYCCNIYFCLFGLGKCANGLNGLKHVNIKMLLYSVWRVLQILHLQQFALRGTLWSWVCRIWFRSLLQNLWLCSLWKRWMSQVFWKNCWLLHGWDSKYPKTFGYLLLFDVVQYTEESVFNMDYCEKLQVWCRFTNQVGLVVADCTCIQGVLSLSLSQDM